MNSREELLEILDYILNRAQRAEIDVIRKATDRRLKDLNQGIAALNLGDLAKKTGDVIKSQFESRDGLYDSMRQFLSRNIRQLQPNIPEEHLTILIDEWLPAPNRDKTEFSKRTELPPKAVESMVMQFVDYSAGRMSVADRENLAPNWSRRYWKVFSPATRKLLAELLSGDRTENEFWNAFNRQKIGGEGTV